MMYQLHTLVRLEHELSLRAACGRPSAPRRKRRRLRTLRARVRRRQPPPRLAPHQYLELEFAVEE